MTSAIVWRVLLVIWFLCFVWMFPNKLNSRSHDAELAWTEKIWIASCMRGGGATPGDVIAFQSMRGLSAMFACLNEYDVSYTLEFGAYL